MSRRHRIEYRVTSSPIDLDAEALEEDGVPMTVLIDPDPPTPPPPPPPDLPPAATGVEWLLSWRGLTLTEHDARGAHLAIVAELVDTPGVWSVTSPWSGPRVLIAWLVALVAAGRQVPLDVAMAEVYSAPITEIVGALATLED